MVYKNFEKNYKTYRQTWGADEEALEEGSTSSTSVAAAATAAAAAAAAAATAEDEDDEEPLLNLVQQQHQQQQQQQPRVSKSAPSKGNREVRSRPGCSGEYRSEGCSFRRRSHRRRLPPSDSPSVGRK